jgi:hypothetical protein
MKHDRRMKSISGIASRLLATVLVATNCSGCFRVYLPQQAKQSYEQFGPEPLARDRSAVCSKAIHSLEKDSPDASPHSIFLAGECYEVGFSDIEPSLEKAKELYQLAMTCGSPEGQQAFIRLGGDAQPLKSYEGVFTIPPTLSPPECGFKNEATAAGYAGAILMMPIALVGGVAVVIIAIPFWVITGFWTGKM